MQITKKFFELLPLFKTATVGQYLILLGYTVDKFLSTNLSSNCFDCSLLSREEVRGKFIRESPKFFFEDLKTIHQWFIARKVNGGEKDTFCSSTLDLIADLAINEGEKKLFMEWASKKVVAV